MQALDPDTLTVRQVAEELGVVRDTVYDWIKVGVQVPGGSERVRLQPLRVGGRLRVTRAALEAFLTALNAGVEIETVETQKRRQASHEAAKRKLGWS